MKKLLFTLLCALPLLTGAQNAPEGFWGLDYYMGQYTVKELIKARTGKLPEEGSGPTVIGYKNVVFAGHKASFVQLMFHSNQLYGGDIVIAPEPSELLPTYNAIVSGIAARYSGPTIGGTYSGEVGSSVPISSVWAFSSSGKGIRNGKITATIEDNVIRISYRDGSIYEQLVSSADTYQQYDY
ncbi:MAG: hypothetical protein JNL72_03060 [Flavipsychrobacter sp.]|nr:hypothetical protein [Flavipsychrobacter sp.]